LSARSRFIGIGMRLMRWFVLRVEPWRSVSLLRVRFHRINRYGADRFFKPFGMQSMQPKSSSFMLRAGFSRLTGSSFFIVFIGFVV